MHAQLYDVEVEMITLSKEHVRHSSCRLPDAFRLLGSEPNVTRSIDVHKSGDPRKIGKSKKKLHFRGTAIHSAETQEEKLSRARRKLEENNRGRRNRGWIKERMQTDSS